MISGKATRFQIAVSCTALIILGRQSLAQQEIQEIEEVLAKELAAAKELARRTAEDEGAIKQLLESVHTEKPHIARTEPANFSVLTAFKDVLLDLKGAVGVGVNRQDYQRKLQIASGEGLKVEDRLPDDEDKPGIVRNCFFWYKIALSNYRLAADSWDRQISADSGLETGARIAQLQAQADTRRAIALGISGVSLQIIKRAEEQADVKINEQLQVDKQLLALQLPPILKKSWDEADHALGEARTCTNPQYRGAPATQLTSGTASAPAALKPTSAVDSVIELASSGISEALIIKSLQAQNKPIVLVPADLVRLHKAGVSENIIKVMMDPKAGSRPCLLGAGCSQPQGNGNKQ